MLHVLHLVRDGLLLHSTVTCLTHTALCRHLLAHALSARLLTLHHHLLHLAHHHLHLLLHLLNLHRVLLSALQGHLLHPLLHHHHLLLLLLHCHGIWVLVLSGRSRHLCAHWLAWHLLTAAHGIHCVGCAALGGSRIATLEHLTKGIW